MLNSILTKLIGSKNERELKKLVPLVDLINKREPEMKALSDSQLSAKTAEFRERVARGESLQDLLPEAFAVCREAGRRVLEMRHFDVQLIGGMVLHQGKIAEMKTGEGKTLVATLPVYLNSLAAKGVHVVTVNDYLARRDAEWMGRLYRFLGLSVGVIQHELTDSDRQQAYRELFRSELNTSELAEIRDTVNSGWPLGSDRFKDEVESALKRAVRAPKRGRPAQHERPG